MPRSLLSSLKLARTPCEVHFFVALAGLYLGACAASKHAATDAGTRDNSKADDAMGSGARIYATVSGTSEVVVIDQNTFEQVGSIPVAAGPAIILQTPDGKKLYTANWQGNSVSAIDTATEDVVDIPTGGRPYVITMPPTGDFVYVGVNPTGIAVIDTKTDSIARTIPTSDLAASLIASPDGKVLYIATFSLTSTGQLRAISTADGAIIHDPIAVGSAPAWITITPDGSHVYTLNFLSDDISVVDTDSFEVTATIATGTGSQAIIANVTPDGKTLWVTNHESAEAIAIDTKTNEIVKTIPINGRPVGVQFNADASQVYITDFGPASLQAAADINYLLTGQFSSTDPGQISVFNTKTGKQIGDSLVLGPGPTSVVVGLN